MKLDFDWSTFWVAFQPGNHHLQLVDRASNLVHDVSDVEAKKGPHDRHIYFRASPHNVRGMQFALNDPFLVKTWAFLHGAVQSGARFNLYINGILIDRGSMVANIRAEEAEAVGQFNSTPKKDCPECWGTGYARGFGAPCSKGCHAR